MGRNWLTASFTIVLSILLGGMALLGCAPSLPSPSAVSPTPVTTEPEPYPEQESQLSPAPSVPTPTEDANWLSEITSNIGPSVVAIKTRSGSGEEKNGSGWILDKDGHVITTNHVVESAQNIMVTLFDGNAYPGVVIGADLPTDIAVIKIDATDLLPVNIGNSAELNVGDQVVVIGNSLGLGIRINEGIVNQAGVSKMLSSGQVLDDLILADVAINPGNSGGPMVNYMGEIVGVTSTKFIIPENENVGVAIGINNVHPVIRRIINTVSEPTPTLQSVPEPLEKQFGGIISHNAVLTSENSPFMLTSHVQVPSGVNLIIEPGVTVDLNDKFIQVDGTLQARGKSRSPIQFLSSSGSNEGNRILFTEKSVSWNEDQESGCIIEYADLRVHNTGYGVHGPIEIRGASPRITNISILNMSSPGSAIIVYGGSPVIEGSTLEADQIGIQIEHSEACIIGNVIKGAARGLIIRGEFRCQVKYNLIRDNGTGIQLWYLPYYQSFSTICGTLIENTIVGNHYHGIRIEGISDPNLVLPVIQSNNIHDNEEYNVYLESTSVDLDLTGNWWGTTDLNVIEKGFYHQPKDFRLGRILFEPFLSGPAEEAPEP